MRLCLKFKTRMIHSYGHTCFSFDQISVRTQGRDGKADQNSDFTENIQIQWPRPRSRTLKKC